MKIYQGARIFNGDRLLNGFSLATKVNKVLELKGSRLEPEHFKRTSKEITYYWKIPENQ